MTKARNLSKLLVDSSGDVESGSLDNVPASDDASALTTGTLPIARIADGAVTAAKLASTLDLSSKTVTLPAGVGGKVLQVVGGHTNVSQNVQWAGVTGGNAEYGGLIVNRTYTVLQTATITPTSSSSKLLCMANIGWTSMSMVSGMAFGGIITLNDTIAIDTSDFPWYPAGSQIGSGYATSTHIQGVFSPNSTATQTIRLRPYIYLEGPSTNGRVHGWSLVVMEIAA